MKKNQLVMDHEPKLIVRDRIKRKPSPHKGYVFKGKSMTIPGQNLTPAEILRNFVTKTPVVGSDPSSGYFDNLDLESYRRMDEMDRIDMIRAKRSEVEELRKELQGLAKAEFDAQEEKKRQESAPQSTPPESKDKQDEVQNKI